VLRLPTWLSLVATVVWLAGITNAINWLDGLDGLAAGVSGIAAGGACSR
jgi:UDP-N-acetylmuramyl pentapeptide phosphotransferase/UDP-N-acetylglucosamine-1-phosphate transferase